MRFEHTGRRLGNRDGAMSLPQRMLGNVAAWVATLGRPVRGPPPKGAQAKAKLALALLLAAALLATMVLLDTRAIAFATTLPPICIAAAESITGFGLSGWWLWPLASSLLLLAALSRPALGRFANLVVASLVVRLGFVLLAIGIPGLAFSVLKRLIGRVRPSAAGPFAFVPLSWRPEYASMPSGHSTAAFAAAVAVGAIWPRARLPMWIYAGTIALTRVIVLAHYPSDVLLGACAGTCGALLTRQFFARRRLGFGVGEDGRIRVFPGPSKARLKQLAIRLFCSS